MTDFTTTFRRTTYDTIHPGNVLNEQSGRTVLIIGGSEGIGFNIARVYAEANGREVIISSRSQPKLDKAIEKLKTAAKANTKLRSLATDASDVSQIESLWRRLVDEGTTIDILVLNAAASDPADERDVAEVARFFHFNITAKLHMIHHFQNKTPDGDGDGARPQKILIDISSAGVMCYPYPRPAYSASKAGLSNYLCHLADLVPESEMRIINLHPGAVFTEAARKSEEVPEDLCIWDDPSLSAHMTIWLSTPAAAFLHGRWIWANWDADELVAMKQKIIENPALLKIGVTGVNGFGVAKLMEKCTEVPRPRRF